MSAGHLIREFRRAYGESPYSYLMTRRIERAMALLRRSDLSVTEVCFAVGCSSLGTFSTRFTELVAAPPSTYRRQSVDPLAGMPPCVAKQVTRPIRNREAPAAGPHLAWPHGHHHSLELPPTRRPGILPRLYRDTLGFEVRLDAGQGKMRWITVGPPNQPTAAGEITETQWLCHVSLVSQVQRESLPCGRDPCPKSTTHMLPDPGLARATAEDNCNQCPNGKVPNLKQVRNFCVAARQTQAPLV